MEVQEIMPQLERNDGDFPRVARDAAVVRRKELTPVLLGILEEVARDPKPFATDGSRMIHIYTMYLLAQFRESRAYPLPVESFSAPGELPSDSFGDIVTEDLSRTLASVSGGDPSGMTKLVENKHIDGYIRSAALNGLVTLVACGQHLRWSRTPWQAALREDG